MKGTWHVVGILVIGIGTVLVASGSAFGGGQGQGPGRADRLLRGQGLQAAEVDRLFDGYVIMQAQESLKLSDQQFPPFIARLKTLQETRRRNLHERRLLVAELGRALGANPVSEPEIRDVLRKLRELQMRNADEVQKAYESIDQVLDVVQQARFRVFEESVERRKLDLVLRARGRAAQRTAPGADR